MAVVVEPWLIIRRDEQQALMALCVGSRASGAHYFAVMRVVLSWWAAGLCWCRSRHVTVALITDGGIPVGPRAHTAAKEITQDKHVDKRRREVAPRSGG